MILGVVRQMKDQQLESPRVRATRSGHFIEVLKRRFPLGDLLGNKIIDEFGTS